MKSHRPAEGKASTGISGLDYVLRGGLPRGHLYLLEGTAGAGKTTLGLQFLLEGARHGEKVLWCTLSETESQLESTARSHHWDLSGVTIVNLTRSREDRTEGQYSFFSPADVELNDVTQTILEVIDREKPSRIVFDPFSDIKLLARDPLRYRRQVLQLREHFHAMGATVILIQESGIESSADPAAEGVVNGILGLYQHAPDYGTPRRRIRIHKLRGLDFREGFHDLSIKTGGIVVYPRLVAAEHAVEAEREEVSSGVAELDQMLGGGLDRGASLLIMGPAGAGKSTLGTQFTMASAARGEPSVVYLFDETERAFVKRATGLGMDIGAFIESGHIRVAQVDPAEFSPGEFAHEVRHAVEDDGVRLVVIDSLNGYLTGMPDEQHLAMHMHELLTYLSLRNAITILTLNQHGIVGGAPQSPVDVSYLADSALLLRYFEAHGAVRRAASLVKRRAGPHEVQIREMTIAPPGVRLGEALSDFRGVLTGQPDFVGEAGALSASARRARGDA